MQGEKRIVTASLPNSGKHPSRIEKRPARTLDSIWWTCLGCALILPLSACLNVQMRPVSIHAQAEPMGIAPLEKIPLKLAVVVAEPHGHRIIITHRPWSPGSSPKVSSQNVAFAKGGGERTADQTNVFGGEQGIPIGRELTKVAGESFSQAFGTVSSFREAPAAGQYDLTAIIQVKKVDVFEYVNVNPLFTPDKGSVEVMLNWDLSVVDRKGVEQFSRKGITPPEKFPVQSSSNADWFFDGLGNACSKLLSRLAKELALSVYSSPEVRTHVQGG